MFQDLKSKISITRFYSKKEFDCIIDELITYKLINTNILIYNFTDASVLIKYYFFWNYGEYYRNSKLNNYSKELCEKFKLISDRNNNIILINKRKEIFDPIKENFNKDIYQMDCIGQINYCCDIIAYLNDSALVPIKSNNPEIKLNIPYEPSLESLFN
jgi:hypothetical protein